MYYDILIIGNSREGAERAATEAEHGRRVALVRSQEVPVALDVMQRAAQGVAGANDVSLGAWRAEVGRRKEVESAAEFDRLKALGVDQIFGSTRFVAPAAIEVASADDLRHVESSDIVLACGTRSRRPRFLFADERFAVTAETVLNLTDLPVSAVVVGAGETGLSMAITLATLGVRVVVVDQHTTLLELCGLFDATFDAVQTLDIAFRLEDEVIGVTAGPGVQAAVSLASGRRIVADKVFACVGREGMTEGLNLESIGVGVDEHGRVWCDRRGRTWVKQISAIGDVAGVPRDAVTASGELTPSMSASGRGHSSSIRATFAKSISF